LSSRRCRVALSSCSFFFQAEDGIRDRNVTGVQTCALPIFGFLNLFLTLSLFLCGVLRLSALLFANALPVLFLRGRFDLKPRLCRSEEHTSELQSRFDLVCRLLLVNRKSRGETHSLVPRRYA